MNNIAPYSCIDGNHIKRQFKEAGEDNMRSPFQMDYDRIVHSTAFRRLEYKTQVFVNHEGDHYRTRLTHTLEVVSVARTICRILNVDPFLTETLALAHDLGHPPFGHAGEDALNEKMCNFGGFDHNVHTLKIITTLEKQYKDFDGLNLTWNSLEGIAKHNGPLIGENRDKLRYRNNKISSTFISHINDNMDLKLDKFPSLEAQIASISDDIAYNNHDIDDGIRAGLFTFDQISEIPIFGEVFNNIIKSYPDIDLSRLCRESIRKIMNLQIQDLIIQTKINLEEKNIQTIDDIYNADSMIVSFSDDMKQYNSILKKFLFEHMYTHKYIGKTVSNAKIIISDLFDELFRDIDLLPESWKAKIPHNNNQRKAEIISDYIAGMTDRYAIQKHNKLCNNKVIY